MGIYQRKETGIYYLKIKINSDKRYKRVSLGTKNKYLAEQIYNAYLLDTIQNKLSHKAHHQTIEELKHTVEKCYIEYLDLCENQNLSKGVIQSKTRLKTYLKTNKIHYIEQISQEVINKIVKTHKTRRNFDVLSISAFRTSCSSSNKHLKNLKSFLNFCIKKTIYKCYDKDITLLNTGLYYC